MPAGLPGVHGRRGAGAGVAFRSISTGKNFFVVDK
jgi:hypothetical protein